MGQALRNLGVDVIRPRRLVWCITLVRLEKQGYPEKRGEKYKPLLRKLGIDFIFWWEVQKQEALDDSKIQTERGILCRGGEACGDVADQEGKELCILVSGSLPCSWSTKTFFVLLQLVFHGRRYAVVSNTKEQQWQGVLWSSHLGKHWFIEKTIRFVYCVFPRGFPMLLCFMND